MHKYLSCYVHPPIDLKYMVPIHEFQLIMPSHPLLDCSVQNRDSLSQKLEVPPPSATMLLFFRYSWTGRKDQKWTAHDSAWPECCPERNSDKWFDEFRIWSSRLRKESDIEFFPEQMDHKLRETWGEINPAANAVVYGSRVLTWRVVVNGDVRHHYLRKSSTTKSRRKERRKDDEHIRRMKTYEKWSTRLWTCSVIRRKPNKLEGIEAENLVPKMIEREHESIERLSPSSIRCRTYPLHTYYVLPIKLSIITTLFFQIRNHFTGRALRNKDEITIYTKKSINMI